MAFNPIHLLNLTELKSRRGNSTDTTLATIIGLNYPPVEGFAIYIWNNNSVELADDDEIVQPTIGGITTGRWYRIDIGITYALLIAALGYIPYNSSNPNGYINSFTESDPTVPLYSKSLTTFGIIKNSTDVLYEPLFSKNTAFNKNFGTTTGTIAEGNDSRLLNGQIAFGWGNHSLAGYLLSTTAYNAFQPIGNYLTSFTESDPTVPAYSKSLNSFSIIKSSTDLLYKSIEYLPSWTDIITKPTTISGFGITDFNSLGDTRWSLLNHSHAFSSITSKPTTLNGYGITDSYPLTGNPSNFLTTISSSQITTALGFTPYNSSNPNSYINQSGSRASISLTTTGTGAATYNSTTGIFNIPTPLTSVVPLDYTNTVAVSGGLGNAIFYLTSDKTSIGTALYTNINFVSPLVNDSNANYTYGWSYNSTTKALTVNVKTNVSTNALFNLLGGLIPVLSPPSNVVNGTNVQILVKGT